MAAPHLTPGDAPVSRFYEAPEGGAFAEVYSPSGRCIGAESMPDAESARAYVRRLHRLTVRRLRKGSFRT